MHTKIWILLTFIIGAGRKHWLSHQQLIDAIPVGQITPGPILSSVTFAGYLINGTIGGVTATIRISLPSFFISIFLHKVLSSAPGRQVAKAIFGRFKCCFCFNHSSGRKSKAISIYILVVIL